MIDLTPFIESGRREMATYLAGVEEFVAGLGQPGHLEYTPLRARSVDDYLRNLLAVGVLNHLHRADFKAAPRRVIVLPDCLKNYSDEACCKGDIGNASMCTQCNSNCLVFESVERFADSHTIIVLEPEDMDAFFRDTSAEHGTIGVVGVACILTLLSGFIVTIKHRLPTQGIFLNYAGCGHHWSEPGMNTAFSFSRMAGVLNGNNCDEPYAPVTNHPTYTLDKGPLTPQDFYRRLDELAIDFERDYLPQFTAPSPDADLYGLSEEIYRALVPDLITRDSA